MYTIILVSKIFWGVKTLKFPSANTFLLLCRLGQVQPLEQASLNWYFHTKIRWSNERAISSTTIFIVVYLFNLIICQAVRREKESYRISWKYRKLRRVWWKNSSKIEMQCKSYKSKVHQDTHTLQLKLLQLSQKRLWKMLSVWKTAEKIYCSCGHLL